MKPADLTEPEQLLWKAFSRGEWVDYGPDPAGPAAIRASIITALLLGAAAPEPGETAGVRIRGAAVNGPLDLTAGTTGWPLAFEGCQFDTEISLTDSSLRTVSLLNCDLPAFDGTRLRVEGILDLTDSRVAGTVQLQQARVGGQLRLRGTRAGDAAAGTPAVFARGLSVEGEADCAGLDAHGLVSFEGAKVAGTLDLDGAQLSRPGDLGLDLNYAAVEGTLSGRGMTVRGVTRANNCRVGVELAMGGALLENPGGDAFFAGGLNVAGGAFLNHGFTARGKVRLIGARLAANLSLSESTFVNPGGVALELERAEISSVGARRMSCHGQVNMAGADISGDVNLAGAELKSGDGTPALNAERARVGSTLDLSGARILGEVNLRSIRVGERLLLDKAELRNPTGVACRLSRAQITADLYFDSTIATGRVKLTGATVGAKVGFFGTMLSHPGATALDAGGLRAQEFLFNAGVKVEGAVDLRHATIGVIHDDPAAWPDCLYLDGLTYQSLSPRLPAAERLSWLTRDPTGHQPQPYEQLAACYTALGQPAQARDVLYAKERVQHQSGGSVAKAWGMLQDITVGYGYRPRRALGWLALLLIVGSIVFSLAPPPVLQTGDAPHYNGIVYALDLMLPVVSLGQKYAFNPSGAEQWLSYLLMAAGWVLATTVAAGIARILRR